jgi:hypothetical protein
MKQGFRAEALDGDTHREGLSTPRWTWWRAT